MFIDICFPKNNEEAFIDTAKKLSTDGLCFIYDNVKDIRRITDKDIRTYSGLVVKDVSGSKAEAAGIILCSDMRNISKNEKIHYFFLPEKKGKKSFHFPVRVTQVTFKELRDKNKMLGISFNSVLRNPLLLEKTAFAMMLCRKYKVKMFIASFARDPYELRGKYELMSLAGLLEKDTKNISGAVHTLSSHFS